MSGGVFTIVIPEAAIGDRTKRSPSSQRSRLALRLAGTTRAARFAAPESALALARGARPSGMTMAKGRARP
ncbi:MAG: hypothetical protein WAN43_12070 [Rhodomicrobium sp.]